MVVALTGPTVLRRTPPSPPAPPPPLHPTAHPAAAANGDTAMLKLLLSRGFFIGSTALAYAAKAHNYEMMKALIAAVKANAKGREPDLKSAMQAACAAGNETVLRLLVEEGAFNVSEAEGASSWPGWFQGGALA